MSRLTYLYYFDEDASIIATSCADPENPSGWGECPDNVFLSYLRIIERAIHASL